VIRRELRRVSPGIRIDSEEIRNALQHDVIKRDVVEGEKADASRKLVSRAANRTLRAVKAESAKGETDSADEAPSSGSRIATEPAESAFPGASG
jgi:hypothetical protein